MGPLGRDVQNDTNRKGKGKSKGRNKSLPFDKLRVRMTIVFLRSLWAQLSWAF